MLTEIDTTSTDTSRIIRYIDSRPVTLTANTNEATTHDVERYCAFQQDRFRTTEAESNPSITHLERAREAKARLLDSIDKAVVITQLLTQTDWGTEAPRIRFLSCRQSGMSRDVCESTGSRAIMSPVISEIAHCRNSLRSGHAMFSSNKTILSDLRKMGFIVGVEFVNMLLVPKITLLPSVRSMRFPVDACTILGVNTAPELKVDPLLKNLMKSGCTLHVQIDQQSLPSSLPETDGAPATQSLPSQILHAQRCALDLAVVARLQEEVCDSSAVRISVSKHADNFSVQFLVHNTKTNSPIHVTVSLIPESRKSGILKVLRNALLDICEGTSEKPLIQTLSESVRDS